LSLIQDLQRHNIHATGVNPDGDKIMRMAAQSVSIEAGAVHLPINAPWLDEFKKEILAFPASKHNDQVDALSQALQRANALPPPMPVFGRIVANRRPCGFRELRFVRIEGVTHQGSAAR
jgi:hypothetical protein